MADSKLSALSELTTPANEDLLYIVDDPAGTPASKKIQLGNLYDATLGSEEAPALTDGNWTVGTGWESPIVGPGLIKNADGTGTQTPSAATTIVAGTTYKVVITLSALTVGSATYTLGANPGSTLSAATTYTDYITAGTTGKLIITPTDTSRFTISAISIKALTDATGDLTVEGNFNSYSPGYFKNRLTVGSLTDNTQNTFLHVYGDNRSDYSIPLGLETTWSAGSQTMMRHYGPNIPDTHDMDTQWLSLNSAGNLRAFAGIAVNMRDKTSTAEFGEFIIRTRVNGTYTDRIALVGTALIPSTSDAMALGSTSKMWSDLFLASGSVINFNNGDVTITHAADKITVAGGDLEVPDEAYDATNWNGSLEVPTKNAIRDKIEAMGGGSGDVVGPSSSLDNQLPRFDSTTGKLLQTAPIIVSDTGSITIDDDAVPTAITLKIDDQATAATAGNRLNIKSGKGNTTGAGGILDVRAGAGGNDAVGGDLFMVAGDAGGGNRAGGGASLNGGAGAGSGTGGFVAHQAGSGGTTGNGGAISITGGSGGSGGANGGSATLQGGTASGTGSGGGVIILGRNGNTVGDGGSVTITGGTAGGGGGNGGNVTITPGMADAGTVGLIKLKDPASTIQAVLNLTSLATSDKTFTFPNLSGTFALLAQDANFNTLVANTNLNPDANDGAAIGTTTLGWSDLFLASGGTLHFANTDWVATHTSGILTVGTGDLRVTTAGTNAASVVTVGGTQTLTSKTLTSPTLTTPSAFTTGGTITLAENTSIALDPAGSADGKYTGITITGTAGATLAFGDLIYLAAADSRWELADADAASTSGDVILGMCVLAAASDGDPTNILLQGNIRADAAFPALTIGAPAYVGTTAGDIQTAQPSGTDDVIRRVGFALTADELYFNPSNDYTTHT